MSTKAGPIERAARELTDVSSFVGRNASAEQLDLLRDQTGNLPHNVFRITRNSGRPAGSKNKINGDLAKLVIHKHGDPADFLGSLYAMPLDQGVELLLAAEGGHEREERLLAMLDKILALQLTALEENWGEKRLTELRKMVEAAERAANALKSKPGEIALKLLAIQKDAAREMIKYVHSAKPVEVNAQVGFDARVIIASSASAGIEPLDQVMRNLQTGLNDGTIDAAALKQVRIVDGSIHVPDDDGDDADA